MGRLIEKRSEERREGEAEDERMTSGEINSGRGCGGDDGQWDLNIHM